LILETMSADLWEEAFVTLTMRSGVELDDILRDVEAKSALRSALGSIVARLAESPQSALHGT
jgi:hypothetical protein